MVLATILSLVGGTALGISIIAIRNNRLTNLSKQAREAVYKFGMTTMIWCAVYSLVVAFHAINDVALPTYSAFCLMQGLFLGLLGAAHSLDDNADVSQSADSCKMQKAHS
jgi:hypothetical protein